MQRVSLNHLAITPVEQVAQDLLGCLILSEKDGIQTGGIITETEAYAAFDDKACHAYNNRKTKRNAVMFLSAGHLYVYKCYGLHALLNIVTNIEGVADAVLIRSIEPTIGTDTMLERRKKEKFDKKLSCGPGNVTVCLGINPSHNGEMINSGSLKVFEKTNQPTIMVSTRIGVDHAQADAKKPWRFGIKNNPWISRPF